MKRPLLAVLTTAVALAVVIPAATAGATSSRATPPTLAGVLLADARFDGPDGFDRYPYDTDIVTQAVLLFPDLVAAASDPASDLTVFLPTDLAFRRLVHALTGTWMSSEADVFAAVAGLGVDTVKAVLSYHIVPGTIDAAAALAADGAAIGTLDPDAIADTAWNLYTKRDRPEAVFNAL
jgi:hypothetical protein